MVALKEVRSMFWGVTLDGGKRYTQMVDSDFHVSMAALEPAQNKVGEKGEQSGLVSVMIQHEKAEFLLCTLEHGKLFQVPLNLGFTEGEEVTFFLNGKGVVHLTGYLEPEHPEQYDEFDSDDSSDETYQMGSEEEKDSDEDTSEEESDVPRLLEFGEDGEEEDSDEEEESEEEEEAAVAKAGKRKREQEKMSKKRKTMIDELAEVEGDDSDSDDEDWEDLEGEEELEDDSDDDEDEMEESMEHELDEEEEEAEETEESFTETSEKKKKKKKNKEHEAVVEQSPTVKAPTETNGSTPSSDKKKKKKKKKKNKNKDGESSGQESPAAAATPTSTKKEKKTPAKKMVLTGGVIAEDIKEGHGPAATSGKRVGVYYRGTLAKGGKEFDATLSGAPFQFNLGKSEVIKGWDIGVKGMKVGGKRKLTIPAKLAYGNQRTGPIPPNSTLVFDVELKNVK